MNARHLIIDLLMASNNMPLSIRHLLLAASLFDFSENSIRVAVTRLSSDGLIESAGRGKYRFTAQWQAWANDMLMRKRGIEALKPWQQEYLAVFTGALGRVDRTALKRRERALQHDGFREMETGLFIRPDNLAESFDLIFHRLKNNGLEKDASIFRISHLDAVSREKVAGLWDSKNLNQTYHSISQKIQAWLLQVGELDIEQAARESLLLGREAIPLLTHDPLLPPPFIDETARNQFAHDVQQLDQVGQKLWQRLYQAAQC